VLFLAFSKEGSMHGMSPRELATWISIIVGGGVGVATAIGLSLWVAFHKPEAPDA
jgi:hypothetical protein